MHQPVTNQDNELSTGKAVGLRGVSHEMLKHNIKLYSVLAKLFELMINYKVVPEVFNISMIKPLINFQPIQTGSSTLSKQKSHRRR